VEDMEKTGLYSLGKPHEMRISQFFPEVKPALFHVLHG
jgi:hypothetical protein